MTKLNNKLILAFYLLSIPLAFGQKKWMSHPRTKAIKLNYIAEKSNLTTTEETAFWSIFDRYEDEVFTICRKPLYELRKKMRAEKSALTATDIRSYINQMDSLEELMLSKKRMRNAVLLDSLPAEKVLQIFNAERSFNYHAIDKLRKKSTASNSRNNQK